MTRGGLDNPLGVIHVKDIIRHKTETDTNLDAAALESLLRPLPKTLASVDTVSLLDNMRRHQSHMALVADEYGSVLGVVAFEDVIEEVVGDIDNGFEVDVPDAVANKEQRWTIPGTTPISRLREQFEWELESHKSRTVAGLVLEHLRRTPSVGDSCDIQGLRFRIDAVEGLSITDISAERLGDTASPEKADTA